MQKARGVDRSREIAHQGESSSATLQWVTNAEVRVALLITSSITFHLAFLPASPDRRVSSVNKINFNRSNTESHYKNNARDDLRFLIFVSRVTTATIRPAQLTIHVVYN